MFYDESRKRAVDRRGKLPHVCLQNHNQATPTSRKSHVRISIFILMLSHWRCLSLMQYVWCPHETEAYLPGRVQSRANGIATVELVFEDGHRERASVPEVSCTAIESMVAVSNQVDDLVQLGEVNDSSIVHLLRARFMQDKIYTWVGNILVAVRTWRYLRGCQKLSSIIPSQRTSPFKCL